MASPRNYRLGKRADHAAETRACVVEAARTLLLRQGADNLVLRDIAKDAGVSEPTIFNQFGSKRGLLEAVAIDLARRELPSVEDTLQLPDPVEACRAFVRSLCRLWNVDRSLFRQIVSLSATEPEVRVATDGFRYDTAEVIVERLADQDRLRPGFTVHEASVLIGSVVSFPVYDKLVAHLEIGSEGVADMFLRLVEHIVRLDDLSPSS